MLNKKMLSREKILSLAGRCYELANDLTYLADEIEHSTLSALDAAVKVLSNSHPLTTREIYDAVRQKGYWVSPSGKTPWNTIGAAILTEIKKKGQKSRFKKDGPGKFTVNR